MGNCKLKSYRFGPLSLYYNANNYFQIAYQIQQEDRNINIALFGLSLLIRLPERDYDPAEYGYGIHVHKDFVKFMFHKYSNYFSYPWDNWTFVKREFLTKADEWVIINNERSLLRCGNFTQYPSNIDVFTSPFSYIDCSGNTQNRTMQVVFYRQCHKLKYFPFIKREYYRYEVEFSEETGNGIYEWKGGTNSISALLTTDVNTFKQHCVYHVTKSLTR